MRPQRCAASAATDPLQGAAIARAVIEALLDAGALVLADMGIFTLRQTLEAAEKTYLARVKY
jgi:DNA replicative helicase MCM subunit Mcm2 (Cdc46/Mcm family)